MNPRLLLSSTLIFGLVVSSANADPVLGEQLMQEVRSKIMSSYKPGSKAVYGSYEDRKNFCRADETLFGKIQFDLLKPFAESIQQKKFSDTQKFFAKSAKVDQLLYGKVRPTMANDGIQVYHWKRANHELTAAANHAPSSFIDYLSQYKTIASSDIDTFEYYVNSDWRAENNRYQRLSAQLEMRINGTLKNGDRISDRFRLVADITETAGTWKISALNLVSGERVATSRKPAFKEETAKLGLANLPVHLRREAMRRGGYSVSVTDFNGDATPDLFIGTGDSAETLKGVKAKNGAVSFERVLNGKLPQGSFVKSSVFSDFDNDGDQDAVLVRFVIDNEHDDELVFFRNDGKGNFSYEPLLKNATVDKKWAMPAAVGDFNADSFLDLYVGYPGKKDFTTLANAGMEKSQQGPLPHGMFFNQQGTAFSNVTKQMIPPQLGGAGYLYPHSALAFDYDQNRTTDLIVIDDRNNLSPMYKNNGVSFEQVAKKIGIGNSGYGMSVATGDYNSDGLVDIAMTNVAMVAEKRFTESCDRNWNVTPDHVENGIRLFKNEGNGKFVEVTDTAEFGWPGAATGGLVFTDYNNDGHDDLYVVNGLWSGNKAWNDLDSFWATANIQNDVLTNSLKYQTNQTQSMVMNLLINYQGHGHENKTVKGMHPSLGGFQRNKLYRNNGNGTFTDVAFLEGIDEINDGYAVVTLDIDNDGRQELLLRNADPGTAANAFAPVQLYVNNAINDFKSITVAIEGTESNKDAIGTEITASYNKRSVVRQLLANNGPQQSQRNLHFGLGEAKNADLKITWPNGITEIKKNVAPGFHKFVEPTSRRKISSN